MKDFNGVVYKANPIIPEWLDKEAEKTNEQLPTQEADDELVELAKKFKDKFPPEDWKHPRSTAQKAADYLKKEVKSLWVGVVEEVQPEEKMKRVMNTSHLVDEYTTAVLLAYRESEDKEEKPEEGSPMKALKDDVDTMEKVASKLSELNNRLKSYREDIKDNKEALADADDVEKRNTIRDRIRDLEDKIKEATEERNKVKEEQEKEKQEVEASVEKISELTSEEQEELDGLRGGFAFIMDNEDRKQVMERIKELQNKEKEVEAGKIKGPGIPDGTGPMSGTDKCPMTKEEKEIEDPEILEWLNNIAYNYNHDIAPDLLSQLIDMAKDLNLDINKIDKNYQHFYPGDFVTKEDLYNLIADQVNPEAKIVDYKGGYEIKEESLNKDSSNLMSDEEKVEFTQLLKQYESGKIKSGDPKFDRYKELLSKFREWQKSRNYDKPSYSSLNKDASKHHNYLVKYFDRDSAKWKVSSTFNKLEDAVSHAKKTYKKNQCKTRVISLSDNDNFVLKLGSIKRIADLSIPEVVANDFWKNIQNNPEYQKELDPDEVVKEIEDFIISKDWVFTIAFKALKILESKGITLKWANLNKNSNSNLEDKINQYITEAHKYFWSKKNFSYTNEDINDYVIDALEQEGISNIDVNLIKQLIRTSKKELELNKIAVTLQKGDAKVVRYLDPSVIEADTEVEKILQSDKSDDEKYNAIVELLPGILETMAETEIQSADWDKVEIDSNDIYRLIADFEKYYEWVSE